MPADDCACFHPRGEWSRTAIYNPDDIVSHQGSSYVIPPEAQVAEVLVSVWGNGGNGTVAPTFGSVQASFR